MARDVVLERRREWGIKVLDWHTQHSTRADDGGLSSKLKRLMPIVGCEADAVAFEEEERRALVALPEAPGEAKTVCGACASHGRAADAPDLFTWLRTEACQLLCSLAEPCLLRQASPAPVHCQAMT